MNREIKFRALRKDGEGWACGDLVSVLDAETGNRYPHIVISYNHDTFDWIEVIPETVCQFTGAKSKSGKEIYESDVNQDQSVVVWNNDDCSFCWMHENGGMDGFESENEWCEIIGNIYKKEVSNDNA